MNNHSQHITLPSFAKYLWIFQPKSFLYLIRSDEFQEEKSKLRMFIIHQQWLAIFSGLAKQGTISKARCVNGMKKQTEIWEKIKQSHQISKH